MDNYFSYQNSSGLRVAQFKMIIKAEKSNKPNKFNEKKYEGDNTCQIL